VHRIVLQNGFLIDCTGSEPKEDVTVVVEGKEIVEVTERKTSAEGTVIDLGGRTIMPGLIDAHAHACLVENGQQLNKYPIAKFVCMAAKNLEDMLMQGFTTVRDAYGADWGFKVAVEEGYMRGPRLLVSGDILTQTGGSGDPRRPTEDSVPEQGAIGMRSVVCDGADEVRKAAREQLRRGVDQVKVYASGAVVPSSPIGGADINTPEFTVDELRAATYEASARGTYVMAHAYPAKSIRNCVEAGVRSVEHGNLLDEESAIMMREHDVFLVPTIVTYDEIWKARERLGFSKETMRLVQMAREKSLDAVRIAHRVGVKIGSGSDLLYDCRKRMARELELKTTIMTNMETLMATTKTNAELLRLNEKIGTIEKGRTADILVINGNPLKDIKVFQDYERNIALIMKDGQLYKNTLST
jgi:imidazolonepropionase-like amidohydrolase